eukprot:5515269-Prymnesium_polylepis.1
MVYHSQPCALKWADNGPPLVNRVLRNKSEPRCAHVEIMPTHVYHPFAFHKFHSQSLRHKVIGSLINGSSKLNALSRKGTVAIHLFTSLQQPVDVALLTKKMCGPHPAAINYTLKVPAEVIQGTTVWGGQFVRGGSKT